MSLSISEYLIKGAQSISGNSLTRTFRNKLNIIGTRYFSLDSFKSVSINVLNSFRTEDGVKCFKDLTDGEIKIIRKIQKGIVVGRSIQENFIIILTKRFLNKQLEMIESIRVDDFNINPILCHALQLNTSLDFIKYNAYQAVSRSIVTSMGFLVQDLLLYSNDNVADGKNYTEGRNTKWDLVIDSLEDVKSFLEIKSGFNDMDAAQIKHYAEEIRLVEKQNNKGFIGITYGKKDAVTVTSGLLESYLKDWRDKVLVGKELWQYVSGEENYHVRLLSVIDDTVKLILRSDSIIKKIERRIVQLQKEFDEKYKDINDYYDTLW